jgi:hypothetical protein
MSHDLTFRKMRNFDWLQAGKKKRKKEKPFSSSVGFPLRHHYGARFTVCHKNHLLCFSGVELEHQEEDQSSSNPKQERH